MKLQEIKNLQTNLIRSIYILQAMAGELYETNLINLLETLKWKCEAGVIRAGFAGFTGSGKSTTVNALMGKILLPENPNVATPVPSMIGYGKSETPQVNVLYQGKNSIISKEFTIRDFISGFCYNSQDQLNTERDKYSDVICGHILANNNFLSGGLILIDTLGINANEKDSKKTLGILDQGLDIVIFETFHCAILEQEISFIREHILGIGETALKKPLPLKNLIILHNDHESLVTLRESYCNGIMRIFDDMKPTNGIEYKRCEIMDFIENNIIYLNALNARIASAGIYPYTAYAPSGSESGYINAVQNIEDYEKTVLERNQNSLENALETLSVLKNQILMRAESIISQNKSHISMWAENVADIADNINYLFKNFIITDDIRLNDKYSQICGNISTYLKNQF